MHMSQLLKHAAFAMAAVLWAAHGWSQTPSTIDEVLKFMAEKTMGYKDWSGDVIQTADMGMGQFQQKGRMTTKLPMQFRMVMTMEVMGQVATNLVVAGTNGVAWTEVNAMGQRQVMKTDLKQLTASGENPIEKASPAQQIKRYQELFDLKLKDGGERGGQPMFLVEGTQKPAAAQTASDPQLAALLAKATSIRMLIGKKDGFVHKVEMLDKADKALFSQEFMNLKFDQGLSDELFRYTPPPGVPVMELSPSAAKPGESKPQGGQP